jgi:hypothetical protein
VASSIREPFHPYYEILFSNEKEKANEYIQRGQISDIMVSERSQAQKNTYCMIPLYNILKVTK